MKPTITAEIRGPQATGKSQLFEHLRKLLEEHPFKTRGIETPVIELRTVSGDRVVIDPTPVAPVPVPLGPNRTRDGRAARVLCNDLAGAGKPVLAAIESRINPGSETTSHHYEDGRVELDGTPHPFDLVGHLPQEPRKPREFWINRYDSGVEYAAHPTREEADAAAANHRVECIHTREVLP